MSNPRIHEEKLGGIAKITYNVSEDGGAIGRVELPLILPHNAIVLAAYSMPALNEVGEFVNVESAGAATFQLSIESEGDLAGGGTDYAELNNYQYYAPTPAVPIITTAKRQLVLDVEVADFINGLVDFYIEYRVGVDRPGTVEPPLGG